MIWFISIGTQETFEALSRFFIKLNEIWKNIISKGVLISDNFEVENFDFKLKKVFTPNIIDMADIHSKTTRASNE